MKEVWLRANRRPVGAALGAALLLTLGGAIAAIGGSGAAVRGIGGLAIALGLLTALALLSLLQPRLQRDGDHLVVRLASGPPERLPLKDVEVFFFGQGPAMMGPRADQPDEDQQDQTSNIVVRLADAATNLHQRDVDRRLGHWCDGYIVIRGTHCEPLSKELLTQLNRRLMEHHRARREREQEQTPQRDPQR